MSSQKYREDELIGSLVVDNEGYKCGYVSGFKVESNNIVVSLYGYNTRNLETPDVEELTRRLLEFAPRKRFFNRQITMEELFDLIRNSFNLLNKEPLSLEHLLKYANTREISVPMKNEKAEVKVERENVSWNCVDKIAFTDLGKCILLNEPVEAKKRGIAISSDVRFKGTEELADKMVIDAEGKIVGSASKFLIGSPPGLSINLERSKKEYNIDIEALKKSLIPSKFKDEKEFLDEVKRDLKIKTMNNYSEHAINIWAKIKNIDVQNKMNEKREVIMEIQVSWDRIAKIGDVIILKEPIEISQKIDTRIPVSNRDVFPSLPT